MRITSLKQTTAEHVTVVLEDESEVKTTLGTVTELRLFAGRELSDRDMDILRRESKKALSREKALELVSQRQMSARELNKKLRDKGADEETADYCVQWILERGLLDEERYAAAIVRHYAAKGYGEGRVRQELMRRGVPRDLWDDALSAMPEDTSRLTIDPNRDSCTLVTCTPYGVNTHRLLVRGERIEYTVAAAAVEDAIIEELPASTWTQEYLRGIGVGLMGIAALTAVIGAVHMHRNVCHQEQSACNARVSVKQAATVKPEKRTERGLFCRSQRKRGKHEI